MRTLVVTLVALVLGLFGPNLVGSTGETAAQAKKKIDKSDTTGSSVGSYPKCEGTLFLVADSGSGPLCQRRDGKICQVTPDTGGKAYLVNCK